MHRITSGVASGERIRLRLTIEGWPDRWITSSTFDASGLHTEDQGRNTRSGLLFAGLAVVESLDMRSSLTSVGGMTFRIASPYADESFGKSAVVVDYLQTDVTKSSATWEVTDSSRFADEAYYHVGTEAVRVSAIPSGTTLTVVRTRWDTQQQRHTVTTGPADQRYVPIWDRPVSMEGRRCYLEMETLAGQYEAAPNTWITPVEIIWRGVVWQAPRRLQDGLTWEIQAEPVTAILDQQISGYANDARIRGVYHPWDHAFYWRIDEHTNSTFIDATYSGKITGFHASEEEFAAAVTADMRAKVATSGDYSLVFSSHRGLCKLTLTTGSSGPTKFLDFECWSTLDGYFGMGRIFGWTRINSNGSTTWVGGFEDFDNHTTYEAQLVGPSVAIQVSNAPEVWPLGAVRGVLGMPPQLSTFSSPVSEWMRDEAAKSDNPHRRIHLDQLIGIAGGDMITLENADVVARDQGVDAEKWDDDEWLLTVLTVNAGPTEQDPHADIRLSSMDKTIYLTPETKIRGGIMLSSGGPLSDAIEELTTKAERANEGAYPFIGAVDVHLDGTKQSIQTAVAEAAVMPWQQRRAHKFFESTMVSDWLQEELKLLNLIAYIRRVPLRDSLVDDTTANGKISFRRLIIPTLNHVPDHVIDDSVILTPADNTGQWPTWEPNRDGIVSTLRMEIGYSARDDDYTQLPIVVRDTRSISLHKNSGRSEHVIAPLSHSKHTPTPSEVATFATGLFDFFANDYDVISLQVSYALFDVEIGDIVALTSAHVLDPATGTRGVDDARAGVIGRRWNLDPARNEQGVLTLVLHRANGRGYAPSCRVSNAVQDAGNKWTCTVSANMYHDEVADNSFFEVGDLVEVRERNAAADGYEAVVSGIPSTTEITLNFSVTYPWGTTYSGTYDIDHARGQSGTTVGQFEYAYVANQFFFRPDGDPPDTIS